MHPYLAQNKWLKSHERRGIHVTAYSPLAGTNPTDDPGAPVQLLKNKKIVSIAEKRGCTPAQVVLQWGMRRGTSVIPKSSHLDRITENLHAVECGLSKKDLKKIDKLGKEYYRFNNPSESWDVPLYNGLEDSEGNHKKHS
jgi:alcohol dehydrogenase (NADP+)